LKELVSSCETSNSLLSSLNVKYSACKELLHSGDDLAKSLSGLNI
jgi:hypothetical protein